MRTNKQMSRQNGSSTGTLFSERQLRFLAGQDGQSAVELALCAPLLLLLLTGVFTYGMALMNNSTLNEATGSGGRKLAISRAEGGDPCAVAASVVAMDAPMLTNNGSTVTGLGYSITVGGQTYASATPSCPKATFSAGQPVTIATTYPCTLQLFRVAAFSNCYLSSNVTEVIQ